MSSQIRLEVSGSLFFQFIFFASEGLNIIFAKTRQDENTVPALSLPIDLLSVLGGSAAPYFVKLFVVVTVLFTLLTFY